MTTALLRHIVLQNKRKSQCWLEMQSPSTPPERKVKCAGGQDAQKPLAVVLETAWL